MTQRAMEKPKIACNEFEPQGVRKFNSTLGGAYIHNLISCNIV